MSKESAKRLKKALEIDIDALLRSDESGKENSQTTFPKQPPLSGKRQKKTKLAFESLLEDEKDATESTKTADDNRNLFDMAKSAENLKNDISKPVKAKKVLLEQFTHTVSEIYGTRTAGLRKKQLFEENKLKASFMSEVDKELQKWKEDVNKVAEQEEKIIQMLHQHLKIMQKASTSISSRKKNLLIITKNFEEQNEQLRRKLESECSAAMETLKKEILELQTAFLADIQREEMASLKKLFCSNVFF